MGQRLALATLILLMQAASAFSDEPLRPGYQVGDWIGHGYSETPVTGPGAGEKFSLVCKYGRRPVVMVYLREINAPIIRFIKQLDDATGEHEKQRLGSYVVLVGKEEPRQDDLKALAEKENIKHTVLAVLALDETYPRGTSTGAQRYRAKLGNDAAVMVVLASDLRVRASYAYRTGELNEAAAKQILADLPKVLSK